MKFPYHFYISELQLGLREKLYFKIWLELHLYLIIHALEAMNDMCLANIITCHGHVTMVL